MASSPGHAIVAETAFELVGVALLAIVADLNKTLGNIAVMLMVSFLFFWFMAHGSKFVGSALSNVEKAQK